MKQTIRLTESQLRQVIRESVNDEMVRSILGKLQEEINHIYGTLDREKYLHPIGLNRVDGMIDLLMELREFLSPYDTLHAEEPYKYHKGPREIPVDYLSGPFENNISN